MYVAITSPYPWERGVTQWYQSLGSHRVWVTTWVNTRAHTNSTIRFRFKLVCIWIWGFQRRVQEYTVIDNSFLDSFVFLTYSCQPEYPISFSLSLHLIASNPLVLVHYTTSPSRVPSRYQSAQRKCRGPVTFQLWGWKYCSHTWLEISRTKFFVRWGEM